MFETLITESEQTMTEKDPTPYPSVIASDAGAPAGTMNVHDQATGQTVNVAASTDGLKDAMRQFSQAK